MATAEAEQERVWFAREVFNLFVKAFTNLKLYPHEHRHCKEALETFTKRLRSYVSMHDVLRIGVTQDALTVDSEPVYTSENQNESLAFRLYVDGLRELSITRGVTVEEAERLALVFYQTIVSPEADATLLLWEADFKNIEYQAINALTEAWESPDYFSSDNLELLKDMNRDVDQIVESLTANVGRGTYSFELSDGAAELEKANDLDADEVGERDDAEGDIFEVHKDALAELQVEIKSWGPDRLLKTLVESALDGFALTPELVNRQTLSWLLQEAVGLAMRSKDMDLLGDLLTRYAGELDLIEDDENEAVFRGVFAWLGRDENVDRLVGMASSGAGVGGPRAFTRILGLMGEPGLKVGVRTYLDTTNKELKDALLSYLQQEIKQAPMELAPLLQKEQPADVVKNGLFVVNKAVRGKPLTELLNIAREHPDAKIQEYATHLWRANTDEGRLNVLLDALKAANKNDRMRAVTTLVEANQRQALERLKEAINEADFLQRDVDERQLFIDGVRRLGGTTAVAFLEGQTKRSTMLFNRKAVKEIRELAQKALNDLRAGRS